MAQTAKLKKGPIPLYYQLERTLRKRILSRKIAQGAPFPTERRLCEEFGVSRTTVRQALMLLENSGLIRREQGRGTFAIGLSEERGKPPYELYGYIDDLFLVGESTRLKLVSKRLIRAPEEVARDMVIVPGDELYFFEGVRYFPNGQSALFEAWVPRRYGADIPVGELKNPLLLGLVETLARETVKRAVQVTSAAGADKRQASIMKIEEGHALLVVKRIFFSMKNHVLQMAITYFPGELYQPMGKLERVIS
jgi:GntR family transcriptional regulator